MDDALIQKTKEAKKRLQQDLAKPISSQKIEITDDQSFESLRTSGYWEDLSLSDKQKCYEYNKRGLPFEIEIIYNQKSQEESTTFVPKAKTHGVVSTIGRREPSSNRSDSSRTRNSIPLITFQDSTECGAVCNYLREHPNANDSEVAKNTRLHLSRVSSLRAHLELNGTLETQASASNVVAPKQTEKTKIEQTDPCTQKTTYLDRREDEDTTQLIKCPYCESRVRSDRLVKHLNKVHNPNYEETNSEAIPPTVKQIPKTATENEAELPNRCDSCTKGITLEEFDKHDGLCLDCYNQKLNGDIIRNMRQGGLLGKDRNW